MTAAGAAGPPAADSRTRQVTELAEAVRRSLADAADPVRAVGQQAYMKSEMPFYGVPVPQVRSIARAAVRGGDVHDPAVLLAAALQLWDRAGRREERYAATAILAERDIRGRPELDSAIEHMVRTGHWWDHTDELAHRVAERLDAEPIGAAATVRGWSVADDFWLRRVAILSQLGRRERLDPQLLEEVLAPNLADGEFFIRKAIGWALREYARVEPDWVRSYAASHELSALSRREALKHLG